MYILIDRHFKILSRKPRTDKSRIGRPQKDSYQLAIRLLSVTYPFAIPSFIYPFSISALDDRQVFCRMDVRTTSPKDLRGTIQRTDRGKSLVMEMFPAPKIINEYQ